MNTSILSSTRPVDVVRVLSTAAFYEEDIAERFCIDLNVTSPQNPLVSRDFQVLSCLVTKSDIDDHEKIEVLLKDVCVTAEFMGFLPPIERDTPITFFPDFYYSLTAKCDMGYISHTAVASVDITEQMLEVACDDAIDLPTTKIWIIWVMHAYRGFTRVIHHLVIGDRNHIKNIVNLHEIISIEEMLADGFTILGEPDTYEIPPAYEI